MGGRATVELGPDLAVLASLSEAVRGGFWDLLAPNLAAAIDDRTVTRVKRFASEHGVEAERLVPPLRACHFLLRSAARNDTGRDAFLSDVRALTPTETHDALCALLGAMFDSGVGALRQELLMRSLADHSNLVRELHWRVDVVRASDHGVALDVPLTSLSFKYQDGPNTHRITLHLTLEQVHALRNICAEILD